MSVVQPSLGEIARKLTTPSTQQGVDESSGRSASSYPVQSRSSVIGVRPAKTCQTGLQLIGIDELESRDEAGLGGSQPLPGQAGIGARPPRGERPTAACPARYDSTAAGVGEPGVVDPGHAGEPASQQRRGMMIGTEGPNLDATRRGLSTRVRLRPGPGANRRSGARGGTRPDRTSGPRKGSAWDTPRTTAKAAIDRRPGHLLRPDRARSDGVPAPPRPRHGGRDRHRRPE